MPKVYRTLAILAALAGASLFGAVALAQPQNSAPAPIVRDAEQAPRYGAIADDQTAGIAARYEAAVAAHRVSDAQPTGYATDGTVQLNGAGDLLNLFLSLYGAGIAAWVAQRIHTVVSRWKKQADADALAAFTERSVLAAFNFVEGAAAGQSISFKVGSAVVERALEQGWALFPSLIERFGGDEAQRRRIWNYIQLHASEAAVPLAQKPAPKPVVEIVTPEPATP